MSEKKNWVCTDYTAGAYKELVGVPAKIETIIIGNPTGSTIVLSIQLATTAGVQRSLLVPSKSIVAGDSLTLDMLKMNVGRNDAIRVKGDIAGLHFTASGEED